MSAFAVVEMFTSEGCSSCPPADDVLADLADRRTAGEPIFTLGFHVDYWDYIGWPDPFGDKAWTERQDAYSAALRTRGLYTPQAVVNGTREFVGSDNRTMRDAVETALRTDGLAVTASARNVDGLVTVTAAIDADVAASGISLSGFVVQTRGSSNVARGENAGRTLHHVDIVRAVASLGAGGTATVPVAPGGPESSRVVVLAQDPTSMRILGATQVPVVSDAAVSPPQ